MVEATAESLFDAVLIAYRAFQTDDWDEKPSAVTPLLVEVKAPAVKHAVSVQKIEKWIKSSPKSPKEMAIKHRLKQLLDALPLR